MDLVAQLRYFPIVEESQLRYAMNGCLVILNRRTIFTCNDPFDTLTLQMSLFNANALLRFKHSKSVLLTRQLGLVYGRITVNVFLPATRHVTGLHRYHISRADRVGSSGGVAGD